MAATVWLGPLTPTAWAHLPVIGSALALWSAVFFLTPFATRLVGAGKVYDALPRSRQVEWCAQVMSMAHALFAIHGSIMSLSSFPASFNPLNHNTSVALFYLSISTGYFLFDLALSLRYFNIFGVGFLIHALLCTMGYVFAVLYNFMPWSAAGFLLFELSTPFVNLRGFLLSAGMKDHQLYTLNAIATLLSFITARIIFGIPFIAYNIHALYMDPNNVTPLVCKYFFYMCGPSMATLNSYWAQLMIHKAIEMSKGKAGSDRAKPATNGKPKNKAN
jgi:hypothetical protein